MKNTKNTIAVAIAAGLMLAATSLRAGDPPAAATPSRAPESGPNGQPAMPPKTAHRPSGQDLVPASEIIGLEVTSQDGERLGRVENLIISLQSDTPPIAIVRHGGALGLGGTRVAVSLQDLNWSSGIKLLTLGAAKEQFEAASTSPAGRWAFLSTGDWAKHVDRFYGQPFMSEQANFERQNTSGANEGREPVRAPAEPRAINPKNPTPQYDKENAVVPPKSDEVLPPATGTKELSASVTDQELTARVNKLLDLAFRGKAGTTIDVTVEHGVVTLEGKTADSQEKRDIEARVQALQGVARVEDLLVAANE